jgi:hypothetical protein
LLLDDSASRIAREIWWKKIRVSLVDIIPPWFYMLRDEEQARWWLQFRDIVSPHRHDHQLEASDSAADGTCFIILSQYYTTVTVESFARCCNGQIS